MFHRHRSFFPLILALLTILLIVLMVWKLQSKEVKVPNSSYVVVTEEISADPITPAEYEKQLTDVMSEFFQKYDTADQNFIRVIAVDESLSALLDLKVPVQYKDLHLAMAVNLNLVRRGLTNEPDRLEEGLNNLKTLRQEYPWLQ